MTKEAFVEWLERQDVPIEETLTVEAYQDYLATQITIPLDATELSSLQKAAVADIWRERYTFLPELGIRPFEWHTTIAGERFTETRYGIMGLPGAWGRERMYDIAIERAEEKGLWEASEWLKAKRGE